MPGVLFHMDFRAVLTSYTSSYVSEDFLIGNRFMLNLQKKYEEIRVADEKDVRLISKKNNLEISDNEVAFYLLLKSFESLGDDYFSQRKLNKAYNSFQLALAYYGQNSITRKVRELKMKTAEVLYHSGEHDIMISELKEEAQSQNYSQPRDARMTIFIRFAYGNALVHLGKRSEAVSYLCQDYFGIMDQESEMNMHILKMTLDLTLDELTKGQVEFGMDVFRQLARIMERRLHRRDCPLVYYQFYGSFANTLRSLDAKSELTQLYAIGDEVHDVFKTPQSLLLVAVTGCASTQTWSPLYRWSMETVMLVHRKMMDEINQQNAITLRNLQVTCMLISAWASKDLALPTLVDTQIKMEAALGATHPLVKFCRDSVEEVMSNSEGETNQEE